MYSFEYTDSQAKDLKYRYVGMSCKEDFNVCEYGYEGPIGDQTVIGGTNGKGMCCGTA